MDEIVSDHKPIADKPKRDGGQAKVLSRRKVKKAERERLKGAAQSAVLAAGYLRGGEAPPVEHLQAADPEVLASELRVALGIQRLPLTVSEIERGRRDPSVPLPAHRPSEYSEEEAKLLCDWISDGNSLNAYCIRTGRKPATIYRWLSAEPAFRALYAQAHEDRADTLVDEMLAIADGLHVNPTLEQVKRAELQISTRKWCAERMRPTKWGTQVSNGPAQSITFQLGIIRQEQPAPVAIDVSPTVRPALADASGTSS